MNPTDEQLRNMRQVIVLGGCHVTGIGIGDAAPFSRIVSDWWGATRTEAIGHLTISKTLAALQNVDPLNAGGLIVLQVGHYDAWRDLSLLNPISRKKASRERARRRSNEDQVEATLPPSSFGTLAIKSVLGLLGYISDKLLIRSGALREANHRLKEDFGALSTFLAENPANQVVVISTFPTFSTRTNRHRRVVNRIMKDASNRFNFAYIDAWNELRSGFLGADFPWPSTMLDSIHINAESHVKLGKLITQRLTK